MEAFRAGVEIARRRDLPELRAEVGVRDENEARHEAALGEGAVARQHDSVLAGGGAGDLVVPPVAPVEDVVAEQAQPAREAAAHDVRDEAWFSRSGAFHGGED